MGTSQNADAEGATVESGPVRSVFSVCFCHPSAKRVNCILFQSILQKFTAYTRNLGVSGGKEPICRCRRLTLGGEDPLEEGMATHSSILAWRIPMDRGAWWATVHRGAKSQTKLKQLRTHIWNPAHCGKIPTNNGGRSFFPCSRNCCRAEKADILFYLLDEPDPEVVT